jgi:DNA (cytosine-5)-methyltransferase 1
MKLKMIDLCAGTGAFSLAFENTGKVECVFANDIEPSSKIIYDNNFNHTLFLKDINTIDVENIPPHDILCGGFPCQSFSIGGQQKGFNDPRSNVFWKIMEIVEHHAPRYIVLENVKNLLSHDKKKTFAVIKNALESKGYFVNFKVLNTSDITGIPQHRERVYIVCTKENTPFSLDFEKIKKGTISSLLEKEIPQKYYYKNSSIYDSLEREITKKNTVYQYRRTYVRENKNNECPTLTANMGTGGHNVPLILDDIGIRKFTPRECFRLQGFPSDYKLGSLSDCKLYKLAGNAVSYPVVQSIANRLIHDFIK